MAILSVPIAKAGNATLDVDVDALPPEVFSAVVMEGLKVMLGKRMSKITGLTKLEGAELEKAHADAMKIAQENLKNLNEGKVSTRTKSAKSGVSGAVMTEARRLAKAVVKDSLRAAKVKISTVKASDITAAANKLIEADSSYIDQAKINLSARENVKPAIDITSLVKADPILTAKAAEKAAKAKAEKGDTLSKTQAGKVAPRKKGQTASAEAS